MTRTTAPTEPCAGCRRPVTPNRWTERSRHTGRPWCDSCSTIPSANFLVDGESRFAVTRSYSEDSDRKVRCEDCGQMRPAVTSVKHKDGTWQCENCRKDHLDPALHQRSAYDRELEVRDELGPELAAIRSAALAQYAATGRIDRYLEERLEEVYGPVEPIASWDADAYDTRSVDEDEEWDVSTGGELRAYIGGVPSYGPEPDGVPVDGVSYQERWWNPQYCAEERAQQALYFGGMR